MKCEREVDGGCLPTATCGLYFVGLMTLAMALIVGSVALVRLILVPTPPRDAPEAETAWWVWVLCVVLVPVLFLLMIGVAWAMDLLFRTIERFTMRWVKCPECSSRAWSKGFTRGFGL
jgi:hypothetical protein